MGGPYAITATLGPAAVLSNYTITNSGANFTINPKAATWTTNAASKTYGDADPNPLTTGSGSGFLPADAVTASYSRAAGETVSGGPYHITATLSPAGVLSNYTITNSGANFTINKASASVTPNASGKTYGSADPALTGSTSGFLPSDGVSAIFSRTPDETVGSYTISALLSPASVLSNYTITYNTAIFIIGPRTASVTPDAASKTLGSADPVLTGSLAGFLEGDGVTATYSRAAGETVGVYATTATLSPGAVLGNYAITYNTANFTINKYIFNICSTALDCAGGSDPNSNGIGGRVTISPSVPYLGNATATVSLKPATLAGLEALLSPGLDGFNNPLPPQFKVWIAPNDSPNSPVFFGSGTAVKTGPVNGIYTWSASITAALDSSIVPGSYKAYVYGFDGHSISSLIQNNDGYVNPDTANFQYPTLTADLTVVKADQTITFGPLAAKTYGAPDFSVSATSSSNLPVSFTASGNCTVSGSTVHITGDYGAPGRRRSLRCRPGRAANFLHRESQRHH
ncbi:MAG: hypothetical protein DMG17_04445 [Acidobacteria bacterium]|nr:MAG: hypothetical protein DMG17_04445 [Acidobacteriota bacterium]